MKTKISIILALLALVTASCVEDPIIIDTDPENMNYRVMGIDLPIATIIVPVYDVISDNEDIFGDDVEIKPIDGIINIVYTDLIKPDFEIFGDITIPDMEENFEFDIASTLPINIGDLPPGIDPPTITYTYNFKGEDSEFVKIPEPKNSDAGGVKIEGGYVSEATLAGGNINVSVNMPPEAVEWQIIVMIDNLTKDNGEKFMTVLDQNNSSYPTTPLSLDGWKIVGELDGDGDYSLEVAYEFYIFTQVNLNTFSNDDLKMEISFELSDIELREIKGFIGQFELDDLLEAGSMNFELFSETDIEIDGTFGIKGVNFILDIKNPVGVPVEFYINSIYFVDEDDNPFLDGSGKLKNLLSAPVEFLVEPSKTTSKPIFLDIEINSNEIPAGIKFDISGLVNPDDPPKAPNVVNLNSVNDVEANITLNIPINIMATDFTYPVTFDFDFQEDDGLGEILERVDLMLSIDNGLPFAIDISINALNAAGNVVHTIPVVGGIRAKGKDDLIFSLRREQDLKVMWAANAVELEIVITAGTGGSYQALTVNDEIKIVVHAGTRIRIPSLNNNNN